jgi:protein-L-isoaspartate(D-aspartate) O-methyltransferase
MRLITRLKEEGIRSQDVLNVMLETPRHIFVDEALAHRAYEDTALPIGHYQTLSQPYIVARMTELLVMSKPSKVLELGTGSGYQTAILSQLVERVYSVERIQPLQDKARDRLKTLGLSNIQLKHADGGMGWPENAPYDAIIVTAAPESVPEELLEQLADGGRLVIPLGGESQTLNLYERKGEQYIQTEIEPVMFVPLLAGVIR